MQGGGAAAPPPVPSGSEVADDGKMINLNVMIDKCQCYARNESSQFPMSNLFIGDSRLGCKSDADEQLILHIAFQEFVKVYSIKFTEFNRGADPDENPITIKVYINRDSMGFEDCEDIDPVQTLQLSDDDLKEDAEPIKLMFVKFQRVKGITLFIEDNAGGEQSALGALSIFGRPLIGMNLKDLKKQG